MTRPREFLKAFEQTGNVERAAKLAGQSRATHYKRYERDPEYRKEFDAILGRVMAVREQMVISPENEAFIRAMILSLRREAGRLAGELRKALGDIPKKRLARTLALQAEGRTNRQIAEQLGLTTTYIRKMLQAQKARSSWLKPPKK